MDPAADALTARLRDAEEQLARAARTQSALAAITERLTSLRDPSAVLQQTVEEAVRLVDAFGAALGRIDREAGLIRWAFHAGMDPETSEALVSLDIPVGSGVVGTAFRERQLVVTGDYPADPRFPHLPGTDAWIDRTGVRSMIAAPLPGADGPLGILAIFGLGLDAFGPAELATAETIAHLAAIALENAGRIEALDASRADLSHRAEVERTLRELGSRLVGLHDPATLLTQVVDDAARLMDADAVALDVLDPATNRIERTYEAGHGETELELIQGGQPADAGLVGLAVTRGSIAWTDDYLTDDAFSHLPETDAFIASQGIRSMVAAPLRGEDGPLGVLDFYSRRRAAFGPPARAIIAAFADVAAIALANARLIEELARSREELARKAETERSLGEIAARIAAAREPDTVLRTVVEDCRRLLGTDGAHLTVVAQDRQHLLPIVVAGDEGAGAAWLKAQRLPMGEGAHGRAATTGEPVWREDSLRDRDQGGPEIPPGREAFRAVAVAPLKAPDGELLGTLAITYHEPRAIDPDAVQLLETLAGHAAVAIVNSRLEQDLRSRAGELAASEERARLARELHDSVTQALFSMTLQTRAAELLIQRDPAAAAEKLASLRALQKDALAEMRSLIFELRPGGIAEAGLAHALRTHAAAIEGRIGLPVSFTVETPDGSDDVAVPLELAENLYRIAQEALHNVVRHARASRVEVSLRQGPSAVELRVIDDGRGFDQSAVPAGHLGVEGMRTRAERLRGRLLIESEPGSGTKLLVVVPTPAASGG